MTGTPLLPPVSISRILFATDFSPDSQKALTHALSLNAAYNSQLYILHVLPSGVTPSSMNSRARELDLHRHEAERHVRELKNSGVLPRSGHTILLESGGVWEVIAKVVQKHEIDLIVLSTHGREGIKKLMRGSVAEEVIRLAPCPVFTVGPHALPTRKDSRYGRILCATDYSISSLRALGYAISIAKQCQGALTLLHVITAGEEFPTGDMDSTVAQTRENLRVLFRPDAELPSSLDFMAVFGSAPQSIVNTAEEEGAELIVMGVHGAPMLFASTHLPWSTVHQVVSHARCPVLTVREQVQYVKARSPVQISEQKVTLPWFGYWARR